MNYPKKSSKNQFKPIRVVSYGIGVIGQRLANHFLNKEGVEIVGAIDINPTILGKDLGEVLGRDKINVKISDDADEVMKSTNPDIVCHTTLSYLKQTYDQFTQILNNGINCVSTCEELSYPYQTIEGSKYAVKLDS